MAEINKINVGGTNYDIRDLSKVPLEHYGINGWMEINLDTHSFVNGIGSGEIATNTFPTFKQGDSGSIAISNQASQAAFCAENIEFGNIDGYSVIGLRGNNTYGGVEQPGGQLYLKFPDLGGNLSPMNLISGNFTSSEGPIIQIGDNFPSLNLLGTSIGIYGSYVTIGANTTILGTTTITENLWPSTPTSATKYIRPSSGKYYYVDNSPSGTATADTEILTLETLKNSTNSTELTVSASNPTLSFGSTHTIGWVGGVELKVTMPTGGDTKVTQSQVSSSSYNYNYPILMAANSVSTTSSQTTTTYKNYNNLYANPYSGQLTATSFYAKSDKRLKENIKPFKSEKSILDLPIVEFDFKDSGSHQIGCIAQDLQEICPEIVNTDENGYLSINENKIVYLLLDEVKKLKQEIVELKKGN